MDAFLFATGILLGAGLTATISTLAYCFLTYYTFNDID